jgi:predicted dehydrogenase
MAGIRLAVSHPDGAEVAGIAGRLRGATVEPLRGTTGRADAVMLVGTGEPLEPLLAAGLDVLLVADPVPPGDAIVGLHAAARAAGRRLAVVNPDRFLPSRGLVRDQLAAGPLGEPGLIRLHRWEPAAERSAGANGLPDLLLRDLDVALWLAGRRPDRVYAAGRTSGGRFVQVHLGFPGGVMALLDYADRLPPGDDYRSLSVIAFSGATYADDHANTQLLYRGGHPQAVRTDERFGVLAAVAQEFVDALTAGRDLSAGAAEWRAVFAVADAVTASLASGRAVTPEGR